MMRYKSAMENHATTAQTAPSAAASASPLSCLRCDAVDGVAMESARTCYPYSGPTGGPDDPNKPVPLCRGCAEEHHAHWDEMWANAAPSV